LIVALKAFECLPWVKHPRSAATATILLVLFLAEFGSTNWVLLSTAWIVPSIFLKFSSLKKATYITRLDLFSTVTIVLPRGVATALFEAVRKTRPATKATRAASAF
jgi:hypothetical protein